MSFNVAFRWVMFRFKLTNLFLKKMQVPEWGKQWYNGLRPENPGVQTLAKLRMGHESPKKNTAFGWLISFGLYYSPLCFFEWCHPCQKEIARIPIHQPIFSWNLTFFWACQGRLGPVRLELPRFTELLPQSITTTTAPGLFNESVFGTKLQCYGGYG